MSKSENGKDIARWMELVESGILDEAKPASPGEKLDTDILKADNKIMQMKLDKLNMLIKKKYYSASEEIAEEKMFQFQFEDKGDSYEFNIPLNILIGKNTREFCANYWNDFFKQADISVTFEDNIREALKQTGSINLRMKLNKTLTKEIEPPKKDKEEE